MLDAVEDHRPDRHLPLVGFPAAFRGNNLGQQVHITAAEPALPGAGGDPQLAQRLLPGDAVRRQAVVFLERDDRVLGLRAVDAVHLAGVNAVFLELGLDLPDLLAGGAHFGKRLYAAAEIAGQRDD